MFASFRARSMRLLRWSERYTKTDMLYLASNGSWALASQIALTLIGFAVSVAFGHFASQDMYGNYRYVLTLSGLFAALSLSGLSVSVAQSTARGFDGALAQGFRLSMRGSLGLIALALIAGGYYEFVQGNAFLAASCILIAVFTPLMNSTGLYDPYLGGKKEFKRIAVYDTLDRLIPSLILIGALFVTTRAIVLIGVYFVTNTVAGLFFYLRTLKLAKNKSSDPELLHFSAHLSAMNILANIADKIDSIIVFTFLGPANLAIYAFALLIPEQIKNMVNVVSALALPRFAARTIAEIRHTLWRRIAVLAIVLFVSLTLYVALAPFLFHYLFPLYSSATKYSQWYALSIVFVAVTTPLLAIFQAQKKTRALYLASNIPSVILLIVLPFLTYRYGILGAIGSQYIYRASGAAILAWLFMRERA